MGQASGGESAISNGSNSAIYVALFAALVGPLLTYLVAARKLSGQIKNSEATELWAESRSIREWSSTQIIELRRYVTELEGRVDELETTNSRLSIENKYLHAIVDRLQGGKSDP